MTNENSHQNLEAFKSHHPEFAIRFENTVNKIYQDYTIAGDFVFAVVDQNGLAYSYALNQNIIAGDKSELNNDSPLYIASHTKSFLGTLLKIMDEKSILDLDKTIADYIPDLHFNDSINTESISIKKLLNHTHGTFSNGLTWKTAFLGYSGKNSELINDMNSDFLHDPSGRFRYSNVGPIIAAIALENETGKSWKTHLEEQVINPLNLTNTSAHFSDFKEEDILPSYTIGKENKLIKKGFYKEDITMHAAGGIISTINDLSIWLKANINQDTILMSKDAWKELHQSSTNQNRKYFTYQRHGYSLGWDIAEYQNQEILTRFGGLGGISFHISFMPKQKWGVIAFLNDNRANLLPHLMANYAYNILNNEQADSIYNHEKETFEASFTRKNDIEYPQQALTDTSEFETIKGHYHNHKGWPQILIYEKDELYFFKWGILEGVIFKDIDSNSYHCNLGPLIRHFEIMEDSLKTGSLVYLRSNG